MSFAETVYRWRRELLLRTLQLRSGRRVLSGDDSLADVRRLRRWEPGDVIFDVGANDGRTVLRLRRYFPSPRIIAFEPTSVTFRQMETRTATMPNVQRFQLALGAESGDRTLFTGPRSVMNTFSAEGWQPAGSELVRVSTIDAMMTELALERIRFLKIDTEGHDLEVLRGATVTLTAGRVDIIQVEAGYRQHPRHQLTLEEVREFLSGLGYSLFGIYNQCRTSTRIQAADGADGAGAPWVPNALAYCDALFVSNELLRRSAQRAAR